jgi:uncharacterized Zn ribbon protein
MNAIAFTRGSALLRASRKMGGTNSLMVRDGAGAPPHHEANTWPTHSSLENKYMDIKFRDSNGALLAEGDSVTLVKDLKLKGHGAQARQRDQEHPPHRRS